MRVVHAENMSDRCLGLRRSLSRGKNGHASAAFFGDLSMNARHNDNDGNNNNNNNNNSSSSSNTKEGTNHGRYNMTTPHTQKRPPVRTAIQAFVSK